MIKIFCAECVYTNSANVTALQLINAITILLKNTGTNGTDGATKSLLDSRHPHLKTQSGAHGTNTKMITK